MSPKQCILKSLAWSMKDLSDTACFTASSPNGPEHHRHAFRWPRLLPSGSWRVLLPAWNVLPSSPYSAWQTLIPHARLISDTFSLWMPFLTPRGRGSPVTFSTEFQNTSHGSRALLFFLVPFIYYLLVFWSIPFLPLIPSYKKFLIMNAMKTSNQKIKK